MGTRRRALNCCAVIAPLTLMATAAHAAIAISSAPTQNMSCSNGVCAPTAKSAVLNVGDLETDLGAGNVTVTTTGAPVTTSPQGRVRVVIVEARAAKS
jgi:hypothetical protein